MKKVCIIHGYKGTPNENWFPWLRKELEERGFVVDTPSMPHPAKPVLAEWVEAIKQSVGNDIANTIIVGHSLGCPAILRYLEQLPATEVCLGAVLVAGFSTPIHITEVNRFVTDPFDFTKIKKSVKRIVALASDNDQHIPMTDGEIFRDKLDADLVVLHNAGHINAAAGFCELPQALLKILEISK